MSEVRLVRAQLRHRQISQWQPVPRKRRWLTNTPTEVLNVKVHVFVLLLFATLPDCSQNQTAVSDTLRLLSDF